MSIELTMLLAATVLVASLWIPYIVGVNMHPVANADPFARPADQRMFPDWVQRARRAHLNLVEQYVPFAVVVLIAHVMGVTSVIIQGATIAFVVLRAARAAGMIMGWARMPVRPILFTAAYVAILVVCVDVVRLSSG